MGTKPLVIGLLGMSAAYVLLDVGYLRGQGLWMFALWGRAAVGFGLAGGVIGSALWGVERGFARSRAKQPGPPQFRVYAAIGASTVFALLLFRIYAYAPRVHLQ